MKTVNRILKPFLIAAVLLTGFAAQSHADYRWTPPTEAAAMSSNLTRAEARTFWVLNYWRAKNGLPQLKYSAELAEQARQASAGVSLQTFASDADRYFAGWAGESYGDHKAISSGCAGSGFAKQLAFGWVDEMFGIPGHYVAGAEGLQAQFNDPEITHVGLVVNRAGVRKNGRYLPMEALGVFGRAGNKFVDELTFPKLSIPDPDWASCRASTDTDSYFQSLTKKNQPKTNPVLIKPRIVLRKIGSSSRIKIVVRGLPAGTISVKIAGRKIVFGKNRIKKVAFPQRIVKRSWALVRVWFDPANKAKFKPLKSRCLQAKIK